MYIISSNLILYLFEMVLVYLGFTCCLTLTFYIQLYCSSVMSVLFFSIWVVYFSGLGMNFIYVCIVFQWCVHCISVHTVHISRSMNHSHCTIYQWSGNVFQCLVCTEHDPQSVYCISVSGVYGAWTTVCVLYFSARCVRSMNHSLCIVHCISVPGVYGA